jgi:hypothetical protein
MAAYLAEKRRCIEQFVDYLRLMSLRRHKVVKRDCFVVFTESAPEDDESPHIKESVAIPADYLVGGGTSSAGGVPCEFQPSDRPEGDSSRCIQFAFMRDCFYLDLPNSTLFPNEAELILRCRLRFYYAKNRSDLRWVWANWRDILRWNPLQKVYLYRDEESAAEDMAFIIFQIWKFPVDWPWYVKEASSHSDHRFERGKPLE